MGDPDGLSVCAAWRGCSRHVRFHHSVPAADPAAAAARKSLMDLGIHPNSAFNGVGIDAQVHAQLHGRYKRAYNAALARTLRTINDTATGQAFLDDLARFIDKSTPSVQRTTDQLAQDVIDFIDRYRRSQ